MHAALPEECFLSLPVEITPELARSRADKMNLLLQVQLLGQSLSDLDSAFRLMIDLARELVGCEKAAVLWRDEAEEEVQVRASRGFDGPVPLPALQGRVLPDGSWGPRRALLISSASCPGSGTRTFLEQVGATTLLSMPLYVAEQVMGALVLLRQESGPFQRDEAHLLRVFTAAFENLLSGLAPGRPAREGAFLDRLTGLFDRTYFEQHLEREMDRARRTGEPLSVMAVEIEDFGGFRERRGHAAGEALLQEVARGLRRACRKSDTLARGQDDRFFAILPRTGKESLPLMAQRVFAALEGPFLPGPAGDPGEEVYFKLSAVAYPDDVFSPEAALEGCAEGLARAHAAPGPSYFQFPSPPPQEEADILDPSRLALLREPTPEPSRLLRFFARLCLDAVPAERVSLMVREGDDLVIQVAFGFEGQEEIVRSTRVPLNRRTVSAWVAQRRTPLLVGGGEEVPDLPLNGSAAYTATSFFSYPLLDGENLIGVLHFSNHADGGSFTREDVDRVEPTARVIAQHLARGARFGRAQEEFFQDSLFALVDLMETQVAGMAGHSRSVAELSAAMARVLGLTPDETDRLRVSSRLHDLGKLGYRSRVLSEPRALNPRERALAQRHPLLGWKFLEDVPLTGVDLDAILYHHEREDGSGYLHKPGAEVPRNAKILAVADVYQALTSARPYRPAVPPAEAMAYLEAQKGVLFDARVVEALAATVEAGGQRGAAAQA